ncbi:MAG: membrane protein insertion efficiency factor YidD [Planctomycetes bacterium]|nr:membrane protein insertion efficiency factor YidD [Planctomycetota bacterium]MCC7172091.1 membrane protein insertion efficiency factor YidD [Planctomycetota bacterium]
MKPLRAASSAVLAILVGLIRFYQLAVSPWKGSTCKFSPTCSQYMREALERRGIVKGLVSGIGRIVRCHPFSAGGYDPVD